MSVGKKGGGGGGGVLVGTRLGIGQVGCVVLLC